MNNYVYVLNGTAYVNLTNKCSNACNFCIRKSGDGVLDTPLWLSKEPTADEVVKAYEKIKNKTTSNEIVYCGYGEPTDNLKTLVESAKIFKSMGKTLRLNTNGLGSADNGRDITQELNDIDVFSISLNECDAEKYFEVTKSKYGLNAFDYVLDFAKKAKQSEKKVIFTVVDTIGKGDIESCEKLCSRIGIPLRVREYITDNYRGEK